MVMLLKRISFRDAGFKYTLSPHDKPALSVEPGETIVIEVEDTSSGQIRKESDLRDRGQAAVPE